MLFTRLSIICLAALIISACRPPVSFTSIPRCNSPVDCLNRSVGSSPACEVVGLADNRFTQIRNVHWAPIQGTVRIDREERVGGEVTHSTTETRRIHFGAQRTRGFGCTVSLGAPQPDGSHAHIVTTVTVTDACFPNANDAFEPDQVCPADDVVEPDASDQIVVSNVDCSAECSAPGGNCNRLGRFEFVNHPPNPSPDTPRAYRLYNFFTASQPGSLSDTVEPYLDLNTIDGDLLWALFQNPSPPAGWCDAQGGSRDAARFSIEMSTCQGYVDLPGGRQLGFHVPQELSAAQQVTKSITDVSGDIATRFSYTFNDRAQAVSLVDETSGLLDYIYEISGAFGTQDLSYASGHIVTRSARGQCQRLDLRVQIEG